MKEKLKAVSLFHHTFGLSVRHHPTPNLPNEVVELRHRLMAEENDEYLQAAKNQNITEIADALGDMLYLLCGTIIEHGLQHKIDDIFNEIQRSNMSKLNENGQPIFREDGKIMKGSQYTPPNLKSILNN